MSRIARTLSWSSRYSRREWSGHLHLVKADLGPPEDPGRRLLAADLADDRALAAGGRRQAQRDGDRRLSDASLAGHEHQSFVEQFGHTGGFFQSGEGKRASPAN
jgi:hypothetical protein